MTLRTYIDRAIHDGADFDAVISGCDVQQTFCWQPDMCITDACEAEYRALLDAEVRVLAAAPGERFSIFDEATRRAFALCDDLRRDHDLESANNGVTIVVL